MVHHDEHRVQILDGGIKWYYQIDQFREEAHFRRHHGGQGLHNLNFSYDLDHLVFVSREVFDELDCNALTSYFTFGFDDATIRALTKFVLNEIAGKDRLPLIRKPKFLQFIEV